MSKFGIGLAFGFSGSFFALLAVFLVIKSFLPEHLPAPAISNYVAIDEKLRFIRERKDLQPRIIAAGSSIAWRQITGSTLARITGDDAGFFNGGVVHLKIHQTVEFVKFYLRNFPSVETVILPVSLNDFEDCTTEPADLMDAERATEYAFKRYPEIFYYLRGFAPQRYWRTGATLPQRREPYYGDLYLDQYGAGPVLLREGVDLGLRFGPKQIDEPCIEALIDLVEDLQQQGIRPLVVFTPVNPQYWARYQATHFEMLEVVSRMTDAVDDSDTLILNLHNDVRFGSGDFYDAFHLIAPAAERLSGLIANNLAERPGEALTSNP